MPTSKVVLGVGHTITNEFKFAKLKACFKQTLYRPAVLPVLRHHDARALRFSFPPLSAASVENPQGVCAHKAQSTSRDLRKVAREDIHNSQCSCR